MKGLRRTKRWLAMLLAFTLAFSNVAYLDVPSVVIAAEDEPEAGQEKAGEETPAEPSAETSEAPAAEEAAPEASEETPSESTPETPTEESSEGTQEEPAVEDTQQTGEEPAAEETNPAEEDSAAEEADPAEAAPEEEETEPAEEETPPVEETEEPEEEDKKPEESNEEEAEKYTVTFTVSTGKGTVKVSTSDSESEIDGSGSFDVAKDSIVTFTVQAEEDGSIDKVEVDGERKYADSQDGDVYTYTITADSAKNVNIYFAEAEEEVKEDEEDQNTEYMVAINHVLYTDNIGMFRTLEEVTLKADDFKDGSVDLMSHAYDREGMVCDTKEASVSKDDFIDGYADVTIEYSIAEGWVAVLKESVPSSNGMRRARAIYVGTIEDVDIQPIAGQIPVSISFVYQDGSIALPSTTEIVERENNSYNFSYSFNGIDGYTPEIDTEITSKANYTIEESDGQYKITATLSAEIESDNVGIVFVAADGTYTVIKRFPAKGLRNLDPNDETSYIAERESEPRTDKKVGKQTEVDAEEVEGFTPRTVEQQVVSGDGTTQVFVDYVRNYYTVTYDTNGGSYIKAKQALYENPVEVDKGEEGKPGSPAVPEKKELKCGKTEHTHTNIYGSCYTRTCNRWHRHSASCYTLTCGQEAHTHTDQCYEITQVGTPEIPATPATYDPMPTKQGYIFTGWYADEACTIPASKKIDSITENVTVYAGWSSADVSYRILFYIENANDDNYSYLGSNTSSAQVGSNVTAAASDSVTGLDKTNFTFDHATSTTVAADGSSVVSVYYKRNVYTLTSNKRFYNGEVSNNKYASNLTLTAKYGANITTLMNETWNAPTNNKYAWSLTDDNEDKVAVFDTMPSGNKTVYEHSYSAKATQTLKYWLENYDSKETTQFDGNTYGLYKEVNVKFGQLYYDADFYEFPGYTKYKAMSNGKNYSFGSTTDGLKVDFYYNANGYSLQLVGYEGKLIKDEKVKLGADISSYLADPEAPVKDADFTGWYTDPAYTTLYTGNKKMPEGLVLYAGWKMPTYLITFMNGKDKYAEQKVEYLKSVNEIEGEQEGYDFIGWYADPEFKEEFDFNEPVTGNATIYGKWVEKTEISYTVKHVVIENGQEKVIVQRTATGTLGKDVTVRAIRLPGEYSSYVAESNEQTITLSPSDHEIKFVYAPLDDITYRVRYVLYGDNEEVLKETWDEETYDAKAKSFKVGPNRQIVSALNQEGYKVNESVKSVNLTSDNEKNIVTFTLSLNLFTITYAGIDDETKEAIDVSSLNNRTEYKRGDSFTLISVC